MPKKVRPLIIVFGFHPSPQYFLANLYEWNYWVKMILHINCSLFFRFYFFRSDFFRQKVSSSNLFIAIHFLFHYFWLTTYSRMVCASLRRRPVNTIASVAQKSGAFDALAKEWDTRQPIDIVPDRQWLWTTEVDWRSVRYAENNMFPKNW